jgi:antitoxin component of MazEF toxin-antitoxin module
MPRRTRTGDHSYSRTCKVRGREAEGLYAVIQIGPGERARIARIRADGSAEAAAEELISTRDVCEMRPTHVVPTGQRGTITLPGEFRRHLGIEEGTPLQIILEADGRLSVRALDRIAAPGPMVELDDLLSRITPENLHAEVDTGAPIGREAF